MPGQQSLRCHNRGHLSQKLPSESFCFRSETATLVIQQTKSPATKLFPENPVLLAQVVDCLLLLVIHPASNGNEHEPERIENATHASTVSCTKVGLRRQRWFSGEFQLLDTTSFTRTDGFGSTPASRSQVGLNWTRTGQPGRSALGAVTCTRSTSPGKSGSTPASRIQAGSR